MARRAGVHLVRWRAWQRLHALPAFTHAASELSPHQPTNAADVHNCLSPHPPLPALPAPSVAVQATVCVLARARRDHAANERQLLLAKVRH